MLKGDCADEGAGGRGRHYDTGAEELAEELLEGQFEGRPTLGARRCRFYQNLKQKTKNSSSLQ